MRMYNVKYQWYERKVIEGVPAVSVKDAEEMVLQKINGTYTKEELDDAQFHIISIE